MPSTPLAALASGKAIRRSRRAVVAAGLAGLAIGPRAVGGHAARRAVAHQAAPAGSPDLGFASDGLGLARAEFEARYGSGEVGQGAQIYEIAGTEYAVIFARDPDAVVSIFWGAPGRDGVPFEEAEDRMSRFLPADAVLVEVYTTPASSITPWMTAHLYHSPSLARVLAGGTKVDSGNFLAAYELSGGFDVVVLRANLFVGSRPTTTTRT